MKRAIAILLTVLSLCAVLSLAPTAADADAPTATFTVIPTISDQGVYITGTVTLPNGSTGYSGYRVTSYLQTVAGGSGFWGPKGTTTIGADGRFTLQYVSYASGGGYESGDLNAHEIRIYIYPVSANVSSFANAEANCAAKIVITRPNAEDILVDEEPWDPTPRDYSAFEARWPGLLEKLSFGICYDYYCQSGTVPLSHEEILRDMQYIHDAGFRSVRVFTADPQFRFAVEAAHDIGLATVVGAWVSEDQSQTQRETEIDSLLELTNAGIVSVAVLSSEALFRGDLTPAELLTIIEDFRAGLTTDVPVTYYDIADSALNDGGDPALNALNAATDLTLCGIYPCWDTLDNLNSDWLLTYHGYTGEEAIAQFFLSVLKGVGENIAAKVPLDKPYVIAELGTPTSGARGKVTFTESLAGRFFDLAKAWAAQNNVGVLWFQLRDPVYKQAGDPSGLESHFGFITANDEAKKAAYPWLPDVPAAEGPGGEAPRLVTDLTHIYIDHYHHYIYGFRDGTRTDEMLNKMVYVEGNGTISDITLQELIGTGYRIDLVSGIDGSAVSYWFVLFGDYNGDGAVTREDASDCQTLLGTTPNIMTPQVFAMTFNNGMAVENYLTAPSSQVPGIITSYAKGTGQMTFATYGWERYNCTRDYFTLQGVPTAAQYALGSVMAIETAADTAEDAPAAGQSSALLDWVMSLLRRLFDWLRHE